MFSNFFSENRTVYEITSKNLVEIEWPHTTSQHGAYALRAGLARLYARMRMHMPTRPGIHVHARTRKHAHTDQYVILIAFPQQIRFRERASMLRYTCIACLVSITSTFVRAITWISLYVRNNISPTTLYSVIMNRV